MRVHRVGRGIWVVFVLVLGCGGGTVPGLDAGMGSDRDTGTLVGDSGAAVDTGTTPVDGGPPSDSGPPVDSGVMPEVCTGGVDEDGDFQTDCADDECWTLDACILADVHASVPDVVRCGDPIELDAAATAAACPTLMPFSTEIPTECEAGTLEVTALFFCDATGAAAALWIEERLETPRTHRMLTARTFEVTYYERTSVLDWERHVSGPGSREGPGMSAHEGRFTTTGDTSGSRIISVRPVMPSDTISRLIAMSFITSILDLDAAMSTDTRRTLRTGGLTIAVPAR